MNRREALTGICIATVVATTPTIAFAIPEKAVDLKPTAKQGWITIVSIYNTYTYKPVDFIPVKFTVDESLKASVKHHVWAIGIAQQDLKKHIEENGMPTVGTFALRFAVAGAYRITYEVAYM